MPIRDRVDAWTAYVQSVETFESRLNEAAEDASANELGRYMMLRSIMNSAPEPPEGCPEAVCTEERARLVGRQRRRMRGAMRRGQRALERHAAQYRHDKAERMDQALTGTRIDGTIRAEGQGNTRLVLRYALCGRPIAEAIFLESLDVLEGEGFEWVGCRSHFRRYGWDLTPPPLGEQTVVNPRDLLAASDE